MSDALLGRPSEARWSEVRGGKVSVCMAALGQLLFTQCNDEHNQRTADCLHAKRPLNR